MSALDGFRAEVRALLGDGVFVRRDRTMRALFICDAPRRLEDPEGALERLIAAGYDAAEENGLWRIDLSPVRRAAWLSALAPARPPCDLRLAHLCRSILAPGETAPDLQPWPPIRMTLLCLDAGETERLIAALSAEIAALKRAHAPLPTAAAYLIEETQAEGGKPC